MQEIDNIDRAIVNLLMEDGRMASAEVARRIGNVSERVVRYRIENLVEKDVVQITAIPNPKKFGFAVLADVKVIVESGLVREVADKLVGYDCVTYVGCSIGETDLGIQIVAKTNEALYSFITEVVGKIPGVQKTTTMIVPLILKDIYQWSVPKLDNV
ncbi:MAG: Lrp/AsnC family transcriptional regulator [Anaerolineales bacterium]|nr:Lrp/AsnC family transcriptional regulator [Anaerolineales bacterium]